MQTHLESTLHMTNSEPYALYHATFQPGESPVLLLHWHPEAEFFYLEEGELLFSLETENIHLVAGDALFIPPRILHTAEAFPAKGGVLRALVFSTNLIGTSAESQRYQKYILPVLHDNQHGFLHFCKTVPEHASILADLERVFSVMDKQDENCLFVEGFIQVLWQQMTHLHPFYKHMAHLPENKSAFVQQVLEYIHGHYEETLSLSELAETLHVSKYYLCRIFKSMTGLSPFSYINKYRIMKSCELLLTTDKKISEICSMCGYNNVSYFNREFQSFTHMTPTEYRQQTKIGLSQ